jgi:hypothetical protein
MFGIVEAAHLLDDADTAAAVYDLLAPFAGRPVVSSLAVACFGSVHHALGMACLTIGKLDQAVDHLRAAVQANLAFAHWPAATLSRSRLAQALTRRDDPGDAAAAAEALSIAARDAAELGMTLPAPDAATGAARPVAPGLVALRRDGRRWRVEFGDHHALVEHSLGMRYLAMLVANPGYEISALELAAGPGLPAAAGNRNVSDQPVLDETAKRAYRQRLAALQQDVERYEAVGDDERAATVRTEREWLLAELTAAAGFGGRTRQFAGADERARISVGKAIRRALCRIAEADPVIERELRDTVQTGVRCCYRPR